MARPHGLGRITRPAQSRADRRQVNRKPGKGVFFTSRRDRTWPFVVPTLLTMLVRTGTVMSETLPVWISRRHLAGQGDHNYAGQAHGLATI